MHHLLSKDEREVIANKLIEKLEKDVTNTHRTLVALGVVMDDICFDRTFDKEWA